VPCIGETCSLYLTCSFHIRKCIIFDLINNYPMFVSPKGTCCLPLLSLVKMECGRNKHIHTQYIQLILPPAIGKYELTLARRVRRDCPRYISAGTGGKSPAMCCLIQSRWSVRVRSVCWVCVPFGGRGVVESFVKSYSRARSAVWEENIHVACSTVLHICFAERQLVTSSLKACSLKYTAI
jgi:hypothetical protein